MIVTIRSALGYYVCKISLSLLEEMAKEFCLWCDPWFGRPRWRARAPASWCRRPHIAETWSGFFRSSELAPPPKIKRKLVWMPNSVSKGFDTAMKAGSSRQFKRYPQPICECQVDFPLLWIKAYPGLPLILSKEKLTWHSPIGCGVSFESSRWVRFHSSVKTFAYWVWHSL